jgi:DNA polymerase III epsilon subunit-like protein
MSDLIWIDIETCGLDPDRADLWEIGAVEEDGTDHLWWVKPDLSVADPGALRVNGFYERTILFRPGDWRLAADVAAEVAHLTAGKMLAGAVPSFDARFLDVFLRRYGQCPAWSHRLLCVETYAAGRLGAPLPVSLSDTARTLDVPIPEGRHSALVDARLARDVYLACLRDHASLPQVDVPAAPGTT